MASASSTLVFVDMLVDRDFRWGRRPLIPRLHPRTAAAVAVVVVVIVAVLVAVDAAVDVRDFEETSWRKI